jgi:TorA maturation chaperone TorD
MTSAPIEFQTRVAPEDQARADMYALLARLYSGPPDARLLESLAAAGPLEGEGELGLELATAWRALTQAAAVMDEEAARDEYQALFVGVGKSESNLHASYYLTGFMMEQPLADVRTSMAKLGLARRPGSGLVEDHLASLCETMRALVAGTVGLLPQPVAVQKDFFEQHLGNWYDGCCTAIVHSSVANFYRLVAKLTRIFLRLEAEAFTIE